MKNEEFPPILHKYDQKAITNQRSFLFYVKLEYFFTIFLSTIPILNTYFDTLKVLGWMASIATVTFIIFVNRKNPYNNETQWYINRAKAESLKSVIWKLYMGAKGYSENDIDVVNIKKCLGAIVGDGQEIENLEASRILEKARLYQSLTWEERKILYIKERIEDQLNWYKKKAQWNYDRAKCWRHLIAFFYILFIVLTLMELHYHTTLTILQVTPTIIASSFGWMNMKRFNELSESYKLTAGEIKNILEEKEKITDKCRFSCWVAESETAFSREHTMWSVRRNVI